MVSVNMTPTTFLADVERYLRRSGTAPSAFGREAVGDPNFIADLRDGRAPNLRVINRVQEYMAANSPRHRRVDDRRKPARGAA